MIILRSHTVLCALFLINGLYGPAFEQDPGRNRKDEPLAESFSMAKAVEFADLAATNWEKDYDCVTCHTNGLYLIARASSKDPGEDFASVKTFASDYLRRYVDEGKPVSGQRGSVEGIVATTAYLAIAEQVADGKLSEATSKYFEHIWTLQNEDGYWDWLKCNWPPFEVDDHYGATIVAIACGEIGASKFDSEQIQKGMIKLKEYLEKTEPDNLHQKAMMLWASSKFEGILDKQTTRQWVQDILSVQHEDGGWSTPDLGSGNWKRPDGSEQDTVSDAYATALCVYVLNQVGFWSFDPHLEKGFAWLKANQRESGRWFVRSLRRDGNHFISHAGTNMALLALSLIEDED